jgi:hypothetical protein
MSKDKKLPKRCECGWILPAAFRIMVYEGSLDIKYPTILRFACGNCGDWRTIWLGAGGCAKTDNAAGFGKMPKDEQCQPVPFERKIRRYNQ